MGTSHTVNGLLADRTCPAPHWLKRAGLSVSAIPKAGTTSGVSAPRSTPSSRQARCSHDAATRCRELAEPRQRGLCVVGPVRALLPGSYLDANQVGGVRAARGG